MQAACAMVRRDLTSAEWDSSVGAGVPYHRTCTPLLGRTLKLVAYNGFISVQPCGRRPPDPGAQRGHAASGHSHTPSHRWLSPIGFRGDTRSIPVASRGILSRLGGKCVSTVTQ